MYLDVARFQLNGIDDDVFGAINTDNGVENNAFEGKKDAGNTIFHLNDIGI